MKYYTYQELAEKYNKMIYKDKCAVLFEAIDYMEQSNTRNRHQCIFMAMGYRNEEGESNTWHK